MNEHDIDVSKIFKGSKAYVITYKGRPLESFSAEKVSKTRLIPTAIALENILNRDGKQCRRCPRTEWLTLDHVVPLSVLKDMGISERESYSDEENLQILCKICNQYKGDRLDFADPRTKTLLLRYISAL